MMEENTKENKNIEPKTQERPHFSIEEWIEKMKLAFANAKIAEINAQLSVLGYTETKLDALLKEVENLERLHRNQKKEYAEQYNETSKVRTKYEEINQKYKAHLALCRILFKEDVRASAALELRGVRKSAFSEWYQQVSNFYAQLLQIPELLDKVKTIGMKEIALKAMQNDLIEISALKKSQRKEVAEAQKSTEIRDKAFDELYPKYADLIAYAKVVLQNEQSLEAMGIVIKR